MDDNVNKKNIAELDFKISDALTSLEKVNQAVDKLSKNSEEKFKNIESKFGTLFDSKVVISDDIIKQLSKVTQLSEKQLKSIQTTRIKNNSDILKSNVQTQNKIRLNNEATINAQKLKEQNFTIWKEKEEIKRANSVEAQNNRQLQSTETLYDKISGYAKTYLIYQGFNELKNGARELIDEMVNVESQMVQIDRVLNDSSLNITKYRDELMQLAYDYGNSFNNVADITLRLAQAGFDAQQSIKLTESTLLALNTAELDATEATDDMVAVMSQWNLMEGDATEVAKEYSNIIDKINRTADNFPTTSADILDALKKTSSAFNLAGASIDETIASIVAAEKASQRGGKAIGTALNNIVSQLKDDKKIDIAESLGISFFTDETESEFKDIMDIFSELSAKMEELKSQGKESSIEMQTLLEVFTLFRRNIGSSLLGEMGEDGTYEQVLELVQAQDTLGYSINENAKYMKTAEAAQQQFNATLLELKTTVWDGGVEDVFRGMLILGNDVANSIKTLIDTFGSIPTAVGIATLAFTSLNKSMSFENIGTLTQKIQNFNSLTKDSLSYETEYKKVIEGTNDSFKGYLSTVKNGNASFSGYIKNLTLTNIKAAGLRITILALKAAMSLLVTAGISLILTGLDNLIHKEEKAIEKNKEIIETNKEEIESNKQKIDDINNLIDAYEKYANVNRSVKN